MLAAGDGAPSIIVSAVELTFGILAVSIPTYRPLYYAIFPGRRDKSGYAHNSGFRVASSIRAHSNSIQNYVDISASGNPSSPRFGQTGIINVTDDVELVVTHTNRGRAWVGVAEDDEQRLVKPGKAVVSNTPG